MASPVVAGTVALMLQANPKLTPNMVKAILQYTAQDVSGYDALTQGAGFLNTKGAVDLARFSRPRRPGRAVRSRTRWSKQVLWGNHRITGGVIKPTRNAWELGTIWGAAVDREGDNIVWGTLLRRRQHRVGHRRSAERRQHRVGHVLDTDGDNIVWGTMRERRQHRVGHRLSGDDNIVWGTDCGGSRTATTSCGAPRSPPRTSCGARRCGRQHRVGHRRRDADNIVWGTSGDVDNIVWGTSAEDDNMTWGNSAKTRRCSTIRSLRR